MNRWMKIFPALIAGAMVWGTGIDVLAQPPMRGGAWKLADMPTSAILNMMSRQLDLTSEQRAKAEGILDAARDSLKKHTEEIRKIVGKTRDDIKALLNDEQKSKIDKMKRGIFEGVEGFMATHGAEIRGELKKAGQEIRLRMALSSLDLKPEQREKLKEAAKDVRERTRAIMEKVKPEMEAVRKQAKTCIDDILTPEQREQLEKRLKDMPQMGAKAGRGPAGAGKRGMMADKAGGWGQSAGRWQQARMRACPMMDGNMGGGGRTGGSNPRAMRPGMGMGMDFGRGPAMTPPWMFMPRMQQWGGGAPGFPGMMRRGGWQGMAPRPGRDDEGFRPNRARQQGRPDAADDDDDSI